MKSGDKDRRQGKAHEAKGRIKKAVGQLTDQPRLQAEGKDEETAGKIQHKIGQIKNVFGK